MNDTNGTFYAVGVGPGDPELLTLQAANILKRCPVIAAPQTKSGQMLALDIAQSISGKRKFCRSALPCRTSPPFARKATRPPRGK